MRVEITGESADNERGCGVRHHSGVHTKPGIFAIITRAPNNRGVYSHITSECAMLLISLGAANEKKAAEFLPRRTPITCCRGRHRERERAINGKCILCIVARLF